MSSAQRNNFIHTLPLSTVDSVAFMSLYNPLMTISAEKRDAHAAWVLRYYYFFRRDALKLSLDQTLNLLKELEEKARKSGWEVEKEVAGYYTQYIKYKNNLSSYEQNYASLIRRYDHMEAIGFDRFKDYSAVIMMFHSGEFMYELDDFEKALQFLFIAERFIEPTENGYHFYVLVLNYIQNIYQRQEYYPKAIEYAQKILQFTETFQTKDVGIKNFCQFWQGFTSIDMAVMLARQKKFEEGNKYADKGYALISSLSDSDESYKSAKYEALKALTGTKLEMGKLSEVERLLPLMEAMDKKNASTAPLSYFKNIHIYQFYAKLYELKGDYAASVRYNNLVKPLQDSLRRRNDVRKLEKIQKKLDAEKYSQKLELVEKEKQSLQSLRNVIFGFMILIGLLAYLNFKRLQAKKQRAIAALEVAEHDLQNVNDNVREKSHMVEKLHLEIEKMTHSDERHAHIKQLMLKTILTEEDWMNFRHLFEKVYPDFIEEQKSRYPDLTPAEIRLLVLEKLGIGLQEMANMLGVSKNAIHQTRYRLRRKMGETS